MCTRERPEIAATNRTCVTTALIKFDAYTRYRYTIAHSHKTIVSIFDDGGAYVTVFGLESSARFFARCAVTPTFGTLQYAPPPHRVVGFGCFWVVRLG